MPKANIINEIIKIKGGNISTLEQELGYGKAGLHKAIKNNSDLKSEKVDKLLLLYPDLNRQWILTGEGEMFKSVKKEEKEVVNTMQSIPLHQHCEMITRMNEHLAQAHKMLLDSLAKRDQTEAVYANTHADMTSVLKTHAMTTQEILQQVRALNVNLDKSNLHFSRITEAQMVLLEKISARLGVSDLPVDDQVTPSPVSVPPAERADSK